MHLAGLLKNSFIDYPGKISCVLFTTGCNFICPYCHNADLARGEYPRRIAFSEAMDFLESRRGLLEGVVITGGEPTLLPGIGDLCLSARSMGYAVKLDTNGSRPRVLADILERGGVDYVAMDVKAPLTDYAPFCRLENIQAQLEESVRIIMKYAPDYEFRTTCVEPFINDETIQVIARSITGAARYALQSFNPHAECLDTAFNRDRPPIPPERMQRWQSLAEPFVGQCLVR
ncbi:MAG: anaerobic ribonucleoside-triphosphate reductase activating protein [Proteobacteria bacterium]|nr:MAG: anaerobic ribonucleoside-triphosphate reductase activating protein [Pseudomonadota bacterium]